jgi:hypothetical protein
VLPSRSQNNFPSRRGSRDITNVARGKFVTGPARIGIHTEVAPVIRLSDDAKLYRLIIYSLGAITLMFTLHDDAEQTHKKTTFYDTFEDFFKAPLDKLVKSFAQQSLRGQGYFFPI